MKRIVNYITILALSLIMFSGCEEEFLELSNPNEIDAEAFFENIENLELALLTVYSSTKTPELWGSDYMVKVLYGKGFTTDQDWTGHNDWNNMYQHESVPQDFVVQQAWRGWYRVVARANDFLENADIYIEAKNPNDADKTKIDQMKGQAQFLRAYAYFHLIRLFGEGNPVDDGNNPGVPINLKIASSIDDMKTSRSTISEVYAQIIKDLQEATDLLPPTWEESEDMARADSWSAKGLLSKVYVTMENWSDAETMLEEIIDETSFGLLPSNEYEGLFHGEQEFSEESLFEVSVAEDLSENLWRGGVGTNIALLIAPWGTGWSNVFPHDENIRRFGGDPRLRVCVLEPGVDSVYKANGDKIELEKSPKGELGWSYKKYVPLDYSVQSRNRTYGANINVLRLADVYLLYAEVMNAQGNDGVASEYMNKTRRRAYGFDPDTPEASVDYTGLTGTQLRDSIREERFRELFGEGHRWFDIKRWGIAETEATRYQRVVSGEIKFDAHDYYLPIPQNELDDNENISQNKGFN